MCGAPGGGGGCSSLWARVLQRAVLCTKGISSPSFELGISFRPRRKTPKNPFAFHALHARRADLTWIGVDGRFNDYLGLHLRSPPAQSKTTPGIFILGGGGAEKRAKNSCPSVKRP